LNEGIYIIRMTNEKGMVQVRKINKIQQWKGIILFYKWLFVYSLRKK
jgi:hypothetical protein